MTYNYDSTLNLRDDLGVDPTTGEDVTSILRDNIGDGVLLEVPSGTYRLGDLDLDGLSNAGIRGVGDARPTFRLPSDPGKYWLRFDGVSKFEFQNFVLDQSADGLSGTVRMRGPGPWTLSNVQKHGIHDSGEGDAGFKLSVTRSGNEGVASRLVCDPINASDAASRTQGIFVPTNHAGVLSIEDCRMVGASDNGLYGSPPGHGDEGAVRVIRGYYANNNISSVRVGSDGSVVHKTVVVNDRRAPDAGAGHNQRGIWVREDGQNIAITENHVTMVDGNLGAPINMGGAASGATGKVTNNVVRHEGGSPAINTHPDVRAAFDGSGNHLTGGGNLSAPDAWVACRGSGCDTPRTTAFPLPGTDDGSSDSGSDSGSGDSTDGSTSDGADPMASVDAAAGLLAGLAVAAGIREDMSVSEARALIENAGQQ